MEFVDSVTTNLDYFMWRGRFARESFPLPNCTHQEILAFSNALLGINEFLCLLIVPVCLSVVGVCDVEQKCGRFDPLVF